MKGIDSFVHPNGLVFSAICTPVHTPIDHLTQWMNGLNQLRLRIVDARHVTEEIPLKPDLVLSTRRGCTYSVIDAETGLPATGVMFRTIGNRLHIDIDGHPLFSMGHSTCGETACPLNAGGGCTACQKPDAMQAHKVSLLPQLSRSRLDLGRGLR